MIPVVERPVEPIGTIQTWESETSYPDETPFVSKLGWSERPEHYTGPTWLRGVVVTDLTPILSTLRVHAVGDRMGRVWMPWAFAPISGYGMVISSVDPVAMASGVVVGASGLGATTVLPACDVLRLMNPGQIMAETTPLWEEAGEIRLLAPGLLPRTLRVRETFELFSRSRDPRLSEALAAITDVGRWLNRSPKNVAEMCRFSLRASRYWGSGKTKSPRPSTVRHLHEVHSFVGSLVRAVGTQQARDWLAQPSHAGEVRLDVLAMEQGVKTLLREANPLLFAEAALPERPRPETLHTAEVEAAAEPYAPFPRQGPPRRPRRAPRRGE